MQDCTMTLSLPAHPHRVVVVLICLRSRSSSCFSSALLRIPDSSNFGKCSLSKTCLDAQNMSYLTAIRKSFNHLWLHDHDDIHPCGCIQTWHFVIFLEKYLSQQECYSHLFPMVQRMHSSGLRLISLLLLFLFLLNVFFYPYFCFFCLLNSSNAETHDMHWRLDLCLRRVQSIAVECQCPPASGFENRSENRNEKIEMRIEIYIYICKNESL